MKLSIIIPCFNEEAVLNLLFKRLENVIMEVNLDDYEVIFINDGSQDNTAKIIKEIIRKDNHFKALHFSRNFGHQAALQAGLKYCQGEAAFLLDADLQDPPELLGKFIKKYQEGYEVVYGVRKYRKENIFKKACYYVYYRLLHLFADINIPVDSGDFCLISRKIIDLIILFRESNKFLRGLRSWVGFSQIGIEYQRQDRQGGRPKYSLAKLFKLSYDGIFGFSKTPLKIIFWLGLIISLICMLTGLVYLILFFLFDLHRLSPGYTSLILAILFFGGIQLFSLGLVGEYIGRIFDTVNNRPEYIICEKDNF
jgi:dolichol-phosphate mannosyltransferase